MDLSDLRKANRREVLRLLLQTGGLSRTEISRRTGLAKSSLTEIIDRLLLKGIVDNRKIVKNGKRGRPSTVVTLNPQQSLVVVAGYHPQQAVAHLADPTGQILRTETGALPSNPTLEQYLDAEKKAVETVAQDAWERIQAITVIGPGVVNPQQGRILASLHHAWGPGQMVEPFRSFGKGVFLQNGSRLRAVAENWYGAARDLHDFLYFHLDLGIGGAVVLDGVLLAGPLYGAGEFGHIVIDPRGPHCACGASGCLEAIASIRAIVEALKDEGCKGFAQAWELFQKNNPAAADVFDRACTAIAQGIVNAAASLGPSTVLLGGGMVDYTCDQLVHQIQEKVHRIRSFVGSIEIRKCQLSDEVSDVRGAVAYALQELDIETKEDANDH